LRASGLVHLDQRFRWTIAITWRPSSVVYKLFTFQASSPKPLGQSPGNKKKQLVLCKKYVLQW
jgi:hypothetical protein